MPLQGCAWFWVGAARGAVGGPGGCFIGLEPETRVVMAMPHIGISTWLWLTNPAVGAIYTGVNAIGCGILTEYGMAFYAALGGRYREWWE